MPARIFVLSSQNASGSIAGRFGRPSAGTTSAGSGAPAGISSRSGPVSGCTTLAAGAGIAGPDGARGACTTRFPIPSASQGGTQLGAQDGRHAPLLKPQEAVLT